MLCALLLVLKRAGDVAKQVESVPIAEIRDPIGVEMLVRLARAWADLGRKTEALELLARAAGIADAMVVPPARRSNGWDAASSARQEQVEARARAAAGFEHAGEQEKGATILAKAVAGIAGIESEEWRQYAWRSIVEAYAAEGRLDRALEIVGEPPGRGAPGMADRLLAVQELAERWPPAELSRLAPLLDRLPESYLKIDLSAKLAQQLGAGGSAGRQAEAAQLVDAALRALATRPEGWDRSLIQLANETPDAAQPAGAERRKLLQAILRTR